MFLSAASAILALSGSEQFGEAERGAWLRVAPSVVSLVRGTQVRGSAVLVDTGGLFLAHRSAVDGTSATARLSDGRTVELRLAASDGVSQLVLLSATDWRGGPAIRVASDLSRGAPLVASTPNRPIRAEFVTGGRMSVVRPSGRFLPMSEVRFEAPNGTVGGSLLFTLEGRLAGIVGAILLNDDVPMASQFGQQSLRGSKMPIQLPRVQSIGPAEMTVAYCFGPDVLQRVLEGFLSPERAVSYAFMGVQCLDNVGGGAIVQTVTANSPAAVGGIRVGDVLHDVGGASIRNSVDFGRALFEQKPGTKVTVRVKRGDSTILTEVILGRVKG